MEVVRLKNNYPQGFTDIYHNVSLWEKVFLGPSASRDDVNSLATTKTDFKA